MISLIWDLFWKGQFQLFLYYLQYVMESGTRETVLIQQQTALASRNPELPTHLSEPTTIEFTLNNDPFGSHYCLVSMSYRPHFKHFKRYHFPFNNNKRKVYIILWNDWQAKQINYTVVYTYRKKNKNSSLVHFWRTKVYSIL